MLKLNFFIVVFLFLYSETRVVSQEIISEEKVSISGIVVDRATKEVVSYAWVSLYYNGEFVISTITSFKSGAFVFKGIIPENYQLECSFPGYNPYQKEIILKSDTLLDLYIELLPGDSYLTENDWQVRLSGEK